MSPEVRNFIRDALLVFATAVLTALLSYRQGITHLSWNDWRAILDAGFAALIAMLVMTLTPITHRYGVGKSDSHANVAGRHELSRTDTPSGRLTD